VGLYLVAPIAKDLPAHLDAAAPWQCAIAVCYTNATFRAIVGLYLETSTCCHSPVVDPSRSARGSYPSVLLVKYRLPKAHTPPQRHAFPASKPALGRVPDCGPQGRARLL